MKSSRRDESVKENAKRVDFGKKRRGKGSWQERDVEFLVDVTSGGWRDAFARS